MSASIACKLCERRRARRHCPGAGAEICPSCCGEQRENTIDCPLDCEYLREARVHERPPAGDGMRPPNMDIEITGAFLREHAAIIWMLGDALREAMEKGRAVDSDAREAIDALVRTYRTLASGLIYESRPPNPYATRLQDALKECIEGIRKALAEKSGLDSLRDAEILGALVFMQRLERLHNNGRKRGRAFLDHLRTSTASLREEAGAGAARLAI